MFSFKVGDKEYKVRFGYRVLCKTNLIDRVVNITQQKDTEHAFQNMISTVAELLLAGLQKSHADEFGYETEEEKTKMLDKVYEILDDYEDEGTEDNPQDGYIMLGKLQEELMENGFLSQITKRTAEAAKVTDATVIPKDHKKKSA